MLDILKVCFDPEACQWGKPRMVLRVRLFRVDVVFRIEAKVKSKRLRS